MTWSAIATFTSAIAAAGAVLLGGTVTCAVRHVVHRQRDQHIRDAMAEQSAVEEALRVSEAHYRGLFEATSDGLVVVTDDGLVLDANPAAEQLMLVESGEMLGRSLDRYLEVRGDRSVARRTDGTTTPVNVSRATFGVGQQLVTLTDLAPLLDLQSRLAHAERLEAVARLAGGVAHDFNNLLTALRANADVLRDHVRRLDDPVEALECVEGIVEGADRGTVLTAQLLAFGRRQVLTPVTIDPARFLHTLAPLFRPLLRDDHVLDVVAPTGPQCGIHVDPGQLEGALMNLVINAADAMPRGGRVRVEVAIRDDEVVFTVEDTGHGIPEAVLPHIFEPFYTTKSGTGSGLGLASVFGFASQSGGRIEARSPNDEGAEFRLSLPRVAAPPHDEATPTSDGPAPTVRVGGGKERILLIDDDDQVRRTVQRMLRNAGYDVHAVSDGTEGLAWLDEETADLLVTDIMMPGLSGFEVAEQVGDRLPVIFVSGYTEEVVGDLRGRFLAKPFLPRDLLALVRQTLDEHAVG